MQKASLRILFEEWKKTRLEEIQRSQSSSGSYRISYIIENSDKPATPKVKAVSEHNNAAEQSLLLQRRQDLEMVQSIISGCVREQLTMWYQYVTDAVRSVSDLCKTLFREEILPRDPLDSARTLNRRYESIMVGIWIDID